MEIKKDMVLCHDYSEQKENVYVWDSETFFSKKNIQCQVAVPFACALKKIDSPDV